MVTSSHDQITHAEHLSDLLQENENPLQMYQYNSQESLPIPHAHSTEEICIPPGEGKRPNSLVTEENCELLTFLYSQVWNRRPPAITFLESAHQDIPIATPQPRLLFFFFTKK